MMKHQFASVRVLTSTAALRVAKFEEREHLVIPVVALVEGVVHAANCDDPALVLASEFQVAPGAWDGRPVVAGHPQISGEFVSANIPAILERERFGHIFNSKAPDSQLLMEAWIDADRAEASGPAGKSVVARIRARQPIEVSIGALTVHEENPGTHHGQKYKYIWRNYFPDHLAFLQEDELGACSLDMGCGALRVNAKKTHIFLNGGIQLAGEAQMPDVKPAENPPAKKPTLVERFAALFQSKTDMTTSDLGRAVDRALRETVPGYLYVDELKPFANEVIACCSIDQYESTYKLLFTYKLANDGAVTLTSDGVKVQAVTEYKPVAAEVKKDASAFQVPSPSQPTVASCGCADKGDSAMKTRTQRVQALIEAKKFDVKDKPHLEALTDVAFDLIVKPLETKTPEEEAAEKAAKDAADKVTKDAADAATKKAEQPIAATVATSPASQQTLDQFINGVPEPMRSELQALHARGVAEREGKIKTLLDTKRCKIAEAKLKTMSSAELDELLELAAVPAPTVDYTLQNARPFVAPDPKDEKVPAPISLVKHIQGKRDKTA